MILANPPDISELHLHVLLVRLASELYALPADSLSEIVRWRAPVAVPGAPAMLPGIIAQRGTVLPVVDMRLLLGLAAAAPGRSARYVVGSHGGVDMAMLVDEVLDLTDIERASLEPPPAALDLQQVRLLRAVTRYHDRPLALIDPGAVLAILGAQE
jgi:purine-binding chemotaxis protein CheW